MVLIRNFEHPEEGFGRVSAEGFARIMARVSDVALVLDAAGGTIRDVAHGSAQLAEAGLGSLIGRRLADLVTSESLEKVEALLVDGSADGRWRHVNFPVADGDDVPISLQVFGLGGGRLLAVGRDERQAAVVQRRFIDAQRELEASHARLRQADLRFHTMLALSDLAVLTLDGETLRVIEVNGVAAGRLGLRGEDLIGQPFRALLAREDADAGARALEDVRATGRIAGFTARLRAGGEGGEEAQFQVALFRYEHTTRLLVRLLDDGDAATPDEARGLLARLPHAIVIADAGLRIVHVNRAFVDLAQLSVEENALGQPLERFVGRNGVDTDILVAALREQPTVRDFATTLAGAFGASTAVDVDAVRIGDGGTGGDQRHIGFLIRTAAGPRRARPLNAAERVGLAERMTEVVGRVSLKEIVRDTTDVIEKLCIETALGMTENNRAAASDMLGISRQSLYAKLSRYGIGGGADEGDE